MWGWGAPQQPFPPQQHHQQQQPWPPTPSAPPMPGAGTPWAPCHPDPGQGPAFPAGPGAGVGPGQPVAPFPGAAFPGAPSPYLPPPAPNAPQPPPAQSYNPSGRRRALLCACNYRGTPHELKGCINDAHCMRYLLTTRFGFQPDDIVMLTDDQNLPHFWPTRANMLYQMQLLTWNTQPGDSLFFHYSGHGTQVPDPTGDESDGMNEAICPCDFKMAGYIIDDEMNRLLVNPLPRGARLHAVIDACHSGSVLDLEWRCKVKSTGIHWKPEYDHQPVVYKGTAGGEVLQIGAARDKQTAADTVALSGYASTGAATYSFIQAIEQQGTRITYATLLYTMSAALDQLSESQGKLPLKLPPEASGLFGGLLDRLVHGALDMVGMSGQTPVMASNYCFDLNRSLAI